MDMYKDAARSTLAYKLYNFEHESKVQFLCGYALCLIPNDMQLIKYHHTHTFCFFDDGITPVNVLDVRFIAKSKELLYQNCAKISAAILKPGRVAMQMVT